MKLGADRIVEMDADFSHRPEDIPAMLEALEQGAQMVIGSRFVKGGKDTRDSFLRIGLTKFSSAYARFVLGIPYTDPNSGFRAYKAGVFAIVVPEKIEAAGPGIVHEILYKAHLAKINIKEVPITFVDREAGESELTFGRLLAGFKNVIDLRRKLGSRG
jgi:dolichol-phosphate mannosyltransferase